MATLIKETSPTSDSPIVTTDFTSARTAVARRRAGAASCGFTTLPTAVRSSASPRPRFVVAGRAADDQSATDAHVGLLARMSIDAVALPACGTGSTNDARPA